MYETGDSFTREMSDCVSSRVDLARTKYVPRENVARLGLLTAQIPHDGGGVSPPPAIPFIILIHNCWPNLFSLHYRHFKLSFRLSFTSSKASV